MPSLGKLEHKPVRAETGEEARLPGTVFGTAGQRAVRGRRAPTRLVIGAGACVHLLPRAPDHTHAPTAPRRRTRKGYTKEAGVTRAGRGPLAVSSVGRRSLGREMDKVTAHV